MFKPLVLCVALVFALPATAQIYEWRDAQGTLNYADQPPPGVDARVVKGGVASAPASGTGDSDGAAVQQDGSAAQAPPTWSDREQAFRERRAEAAEARAKADEERRRAAERETYCNRARNQLAALESGQRLSRFNDRGEPEVLDEAARKEEITRARNYLTASCK